jgi:hypothetical protein
MSTTYGFGMRVADIKATGGDIKQAMKVGHIPWALLRCEIICRRCSLADPFEVLLVNAIILHAYQRLQQNGVSSALLPSVPHEKVSASLLSTWGCLSWLDCLISICVHLPMQTAGTSLRSINSRNVHQFRIASVSTPNFFIAFCQKAKGIMPRYICNVDTILAGQMLS